MKTLIALTTAATFAATTAFADTPTMNMDAETIVKEAAHTGTTQADLMIPLIFLAIVAAASLVDGGTTRLIKVPQ